MDTTPSIVSPALAVMLEVAVVGVILRVRS